MTAPKPLPLYTSHPTSVPGERAPALPPFPRQEGVSLLGLFYVLLDTLASEWKRVTLSTIAET